MYDVSFLFSFNFFQNVFSEQKDIAYVIRYSIFKKGEEEQIDIHDSCNKPYVKKTSEVDNDNLLLETAIDGQNDDEPCDEKNSGAPKNKKRSKARIIRTVSFNKESHPEKHYRELIMLFTSWRNEETDLIGNCSSYQEYFFLMKDKIDDQMKQYAICSEDLNQMEEHLNNMEENDDNFDLIAPTTQDIEHQDEADGAQDLHPDFNESYDLSEDIGIPSTASNNEQLILNEVQDQHYRQMVQRLNKEQK